MKNIKLVCIALVLILTCCACKQDESVLSNKDVNKISQAVDKSFTGLIGAARSLNVDAYFQYFDRKHFTALNADGTVVHSMEAFEEVARQQFAALESYRSLEFSQVKISVINRETAVLVNEYKADVVLKSGDLVSASGGGTQVWALRDGAWKLVSVSSSVSVPQS